jgi:hypothetical protein
MMRQAIASASSLRHVIAEWQPAGARTSALARARRCSYRGGTWRGRQRTQPRYYASYVRSQLKQTPPSGGGEGGVGGGEGGGRGPGGIFRFHQFIVVRRTCVR